MSSGKGMSSNLRPPNHKPITLPVDIKPRDFVNIISSNVGAESFSIIKNTSHCINRIRYKYFSAY